MTSETWQYQELLQWFIDVCRHEPTAHYAAGIAQLHFKRSHMNLFSVLGGPRCISLPSSAVFALNSFSKIDPQHQARPPRQIYLHKNQNQDPY